MARRHGGDARARGGDAACMPRWARRHDGGVGERQREGMSGWRGSTEARARVRARVGGAARVPEWARWHNGGVGERQHERDVRAWCQARRRV